MNKTATLSVLIITLTLPLSSHAATYRVRTAEDFNRQAALLKQWVTTPVEPALS